MITSPSLELHAEMSADFDPCNQGGAGDGYKTGLKLTAVKVAMAEALGVNMLLFRPAIYLGEFLKLYLHGGKAVKWGQFQFCRMSWG